MARILLLEDDETIAFGIETILRKNNHDLIWRSSVVEGLAAFDSSVDLILLDLNLPDGDGYDFCTRVKARSRVPIIMLTVRDDERDIVKGLDLGADDYIVKPFQLSVLLSRIHAVLRRTGGHLLCRLRCGDILLDKSETRVSLKGRDISLTAGEYRLLLTLLENKNQTLTRRRLLELLWDADENFVNDNTLTVTMKRLREKLGRPAYIRTLRGIGYRIEEPNGEEK